MIDLPTVQPTLVVGEINLETGEFTPKDPIYFKCINTIDCCSKMNIPITSYDIQRILDNGYEIDQIVKDLSPVILNPNTPDNRKQAAYFLKSKPYDGTCTFLEHRLCSIHEFKPFACRIYPFALEFQDENIVLIILNQNQICSSIKHVKKSVSNNFELLKDIYQMLKTEILLREQFVAVD